MSHASRELKLGHTAEVNGHLAAHNIVADLHGQPLLTYPRGVTGSDTTPKIWCLSLGRYDAIVGFNGLVFCGWCTHSRPLRRAANTARRHHDGAAPPPAHRGTAPHSTRTQ
jgi:hypothetical protein